MRKTYSSEFKAKLVMEVLRGERLLNEIASENNIHPNMLTRWKTDAVNNFHILFENENAKAWYNRLRIQSFHSVKGDIKNR